MYNVAEERTRTLLTTELNNRFFAKWDGEDDDVRKLVESARAQPPRLSEEDISRIADEVVSRSRDERNGLRIADNARNLAIGIIGGLISTGILDLIAYSHHFIRWLGGPSDLGEQKLLKTRQAEAARRNILGYLEWRDFDDIEKGAGMIEDRANKVYDLVVECSLEAGLIDEQDPIRWGGNGIPIAAHDFVTALFQTASETLGQKSTAR